MLFKFGMKNHSKNMGKVSLFSPRKKMKGIFSINTVDPFKKEVAAAAAAKQLAMETTSKKKKSVRFNLCANRTFVYSRKMSQNELKRTCWYTEGDLQEMKQNHVVTVSHLFNKNNAWRDAFHHAYSECRKVKRGDMDTLTGHVDRERLVQAYQQHELVGLEKYIMFSLRGSVAKQVLRILQHVDGLEKRSFDEAAFTHKCRSMTQPSSVLVREMAIAQASACQI